MMGLRHQVEQWIEAGEASRVLSGLTMLWHDSPNLATAAFVQSRFQAVREELGLPVLRVAILRSFTVEPIVALLRAEALAYGVELDIYLGGIDTYAVEVLDPQSELHQFSPQVTILALLSESLPPKDAWERLETWITASLTHSSSRLVVHNLEERPEVNGRLAETDGVSILDYDGLVARHGRSNWWDEGKWESVGLPIAARHLIHLSREWLRSLLGMAGRVCKVLVTDLDDTVWAGTVGEDGPCGVDPHTDLQAYLLELRRCGVLLAACSKNDVGPVEEALRGHSKMLLKSEHFAAWRISWKDKATSLVEIAEELQVGLDTLVFLDNDPRERDLVRTRLPEVTVIDLPESPEDFVGRIKDCPLLGIGETTAEDKARAGYYRDERRRERLREAVPTLEEYYWSLGIEVEVASLGREDMTRACQLIARTNQFNLTRPTYTENGLRQLISTEGTWVNGARVRDRYGDSGLVGLTILKRLPDAAVFEIDTFLLSCRVLGRKVETALLAQLAGQALRNGGSTLRGLFRSDRANPGAASFYPSHGFRVVSDGVWELCLDRVLSIPDWLTLKESC
jgi:FkbH-like protein